MLDNTFPGGPGEFDLATELDRLAREDRAREERAAMIRGVRARRRGSHGSNTWGFMVPGAGKRR